mgnify:CR=1 FL=1
MTDPKVETVPLRDLIAIKQILKDREKKWEIEKTRLFSQVGQLQNELKIAKANGEDSAEVELVKKSLLDQADKIKTDREKFEDDLNSYNKREREFRAGKLAFDLKAKGVEIEAESLLNEEDMDAKSRDLLVEHLAKENESLKANQSNSPGESVFERGSGGLLKKQPKDMDDAEFAGYEKAIKGQALSKV